MREKEIRLSVWRESGCGEMISIPVSEKERRVFWTKLKERIEEELDGSNTRRV